MYKNKKYRSGTSSILGNTSQANKTTSLSGVQSSIGQQQTLLQDKQNVRATGTLAAAAATSSLLSKHPIPAKISKPNEPTSGGVDVTDEEMFTIPASQMPSQRRYISQRSVVGLGRTQSTLLSQTNPKRQRLPKNYFEKILQKAKVNLDSDDSFCLEIDHIGFVCLLRQQLQTSNDYPENVQEFLNGINDELKEPQMCWKLLTGCKITLPNSEVVNISQESLMKDFLMIDFLQTDLLTILFAKMKIFAIIDEGQNSFFVDLIMSHLKFINQNQIKNGEFIFNNIFDIVGVATNNSRNIIIKGLEDIVDLMRHDDVVKKLMQIFTSDAELLTKSTVTTMGNMCLKPDIQSQLRCRIINYMKNNAPISLFPVFTKFILNFSHQEVHTLPNLIRDLQNCLKWSKGSTATTTTKEINTSQQEVFQCIANTLIRSKNFYSIWLKTIQTNNETTHSVDLLILLIMISINDDRSYYIEQVIRRKIKLQQLTVNNFEDCVINYPIILNEYSKIFLKLLDNFFGDKNQLISNFGNAAYNLVFSIESWDRKLLLSKLVGFVCQKNDSDITTNALMVLTDINRKYAAELQHNGNQLLRILDQTNDLTLAQIRLVMDLLCSLAYPAPPAEGQPELQEHLDMMIRKQVSSSIISTKNQGIVGIGRVIDHTIWKLTATELNTEETYETIDDLPDMCAQIAAKYIELIINSTMDCPESLALCYDELASIIHRRNPKYRSFFINSYFLIWLCDLMTNDLQDNFLIDKPPAVNECGGIKMTYQLGLNTPEESESTEVNSLAINIGQLVIRSSTGMTNSPSSIIVLTSLFHLVRVLQFVRYDGNLEPINAVLGCALAIPKCWDLTTTTITDTIDIFDEYDEIKSKKILDTLFYSVNWIREMISGFVSQDDEMIKRKILIRLTELIRLENLIRQVLRRAPIEYLAPNCHFMSSTISAGKFKKPCAPIRKPPTIIKLKQKGQTTQQQSESTENMTILATMRSQQDNSALLNKHRPGGSSSGGSVSCGKDLLMSYGPRETYRDLDIETILILRENLVIEFPLSEEKVGNLLGLAELRFLLEDLVIKLESIFGIRKFSSSFDSALLGGTINKQQNYTHNSNDLVSDLVKMLPKIMEFFQQLINKLKDCQTDGNLVGSSTSAGGSSNNRINKYTDEMNNVKICVGLCLRLLAAFYTWPGFDDTENHINLRNSLKILSSNSGIDCVDNDDDIEKLTIASINLLIEKESIILDLTSAVNMFNLVKSLSKFCSTNIEIQQQIVKLCRKFLCRQWFSFTGAMERGAQCNILLDQLLKGLFVDIKLTTINQYVGKILKEVTHLNGKSDTLKIFPCFYKANFPLLYRTICGALISTVNQRIVQAGPTSGQLKLWEDSCDLINGLLMIVEAINIPRNYSLFLRNAHIFLKLFLQHGLPILEICFRTNAERVQQILRCLQDTTRFLHRLCCHSKTIQLTAIVQQIPFLRQTVENLLVRVQALLVANKCCSNDVWKIGNLKNKDLQGHVLNQIQNVNDSDELNDDYMPEDDDNLDDGDDDNGGMDMQRTIRDTTSETSSTSSVLSDSTTVNSNSSRSRVF